MKPTQQEIIDLAREAGFGIGQGISAIRINGYADDLLRLAELLLERFGAGGGEPSRDMPHGWVTNWPAPSGGTRPVYHASAIKPKYGPELDNSLVSYPVFTRPGSSPTDLRAEYLRGLEDAKKACVASELIDLPTIKEIAAIRKCAQAIEALKGKQ